MLLPHLAPSAEDDSEMWFRVLESATKSRCFLSNAETNNCYQFVNIIFQARKRKKSLSELFWEVDRFEFECFFPSSKFLPPVRYLTQIYDQLLLLSPFCWFYICRGRDMKTSRAAFWGHDVWLAEADIKTHTTAGLVFFYVVLTFLRLFYVFVFYYSRRKWASLTALIVFVSTQQQLFVSISSPCRCSRTSFDLLVYGCLCAESSVRSDPQVSRGLRAFQSTVSLLERSLDLWPPPLAPRRSLGQS